MFNIVFTATVLLFFSGSVLSIYSLHTDNNTFPRSARLIFLISIVSFIALGVTRFGHISGPGLLGAAFTIWGYFYILSFIMICFLLYFHFSKWKKEWISLSAFGMTFITIILLISLPFIDSHRHINIDFNHGLIPLHILIAILGELFFFFSFVGSVLYLVMEQQLHKKSSMKFIFRLPALESIDGFNKWSITWSFIMLSCGLVLGIFLAWHAFSSPFMGSPKEVIIYISWLVLLGLFCLRFSHRITRHRVNLVNTLLFIVLMVTFIFTNIYFTKGFHSFK